MLTNIDQDLVNILTDSEQTYQPMDAFSTQDTRNLWLNALFVCSQLKSICMVTYVYTYKLKFKWFMKKKT